MNMAYDCSKVLTEDGDRRVLYLAYDKRPTRRWVAQEHLLEPRITRNFAS